MTLTRLEKLLYRLEAQHVCLAWAFGQIADRPGVVFELGLGKGRTFDHLRRHLPDREIHVFERFVDAYPDCRPDPAFLREGDIAETLPACLPEFAGRVVLAHADTGSFDDRHNRAMADLVSRLLPPHLADGALILSDLQLAMTDAEPVALPSGAREGRYFIYRHRAPGAA